MNDEYEQICRQAAVWVQEAGAIARDRFGRAVATRKADDSPVTDADHAAQ